MNKEIQSLDLLIEMIQKEKDKILKKEIQDKKDEKTKIPKSITPEDSLLIKVLAEQVRWFRIGGPDLEKTIEITIKTNATLIMNKEIGIENYQILYNNKPYDFDGLIEDLFNKDLDKYQKQFNCIYDTIDKLSKKYPDANIRGMIFGSN